VSNADRSEADWVDIKACLAGDEQSYARLVRRYESEVAKLMWRFSRNAAVCEELVEEVFVEAYFSLGRYRGKGPFAHWLKKIATRVGYKFWKKQARQRRRTELRDYDGSVTNDESVDPSVAGRILDSLLSRLGRADRLVLTLMYFDGCGTQEIAKRMGWSRAMVKMRASRARKKMRTIAEKEGILEELGWIR